jgi:hypothetical protein
VLDHRINLLFECCEVDLRAVQHGAPVPSDRPRGDGLADFFVSGAVELGNSRVPINAIDARDLLPEDP